MAMIPRIQHDETVPSTPNFASAPPIHAPHPSEQERTYAESALVFAGPAGVAKLDSTVVIGSSLLRGGAKLLWRPLCGAARIREERDGWVNLGR